MYRLFGFCLGSIASVSALMFLIGWPDFHLSGESDDADRYDMAVQKLKDKQRTAEPVTPDRSTPPVIPETSLPEANSEIDAVAIDSDLPRTTTVDLPAEDEAVTEIVDTMMPDDPIGTELAPAPAEAWHTIWTPFRSRIAADGFVSRLESVTGLDYRVMQVKNGVYEVAFAYADQAELDTNLARISAATGLDLGTDPP